MSISDDKKELLEVEAMFAERMPGKDVELHARVTLVFELAHGMLDAALADLDVLRRVAPSLVAWREMRSRVARRLSFKVMA